MSTPSRSPFTWLLSAFLTAQLGLLWLHGALLHRQQAQLTQIHEDLQDLADALDAQNNGDSGDQGSSDWSPARHGSRHHGHLSRVRQEEGKTPPPAKEEEDPNLEQTRKELEASKKSGQEAVAKARERQSQLSIQENYRKGQEQRAIQEARYEWTRWVWVALLVLAAAFGIRAYLKRNA